MVCSKCGAQLKEGCIYCSQCGQEAQMVSEISILEDDLLRKMMDEEEAAAKETSAETASADTSQSDSVRDTDLARRKEEQKKQKREEKKRKKLIRTLVVTIVILIAALITIFSIVHYEQMHSVSYLMGKAEDAFNQKDYDKAEEYISRVLDLDANDQDALLLDGQIALEQSDYETAEQRFIAVISLDSTCKEAYEGLIELYELQGKTNEILMLKDGVEDEDILALFADYIVAVPELSKESGTFSEYFSVEITAPEKNLKIYYTLDGTTPTSESTRYEEPIEIAEQGTIVLTAVCMNPDGIYSDPVVAEYEVELEAPDTPVVSPDGGQFSMASTVTIRVPEGTTVYYTWDGSEPDENSSVYTEPLAIPEGNNVLSVIAIDEYGMKSSVMKCNYIYYPETQDNTEDTETIDGGQ